jgi:5-methylcytosine-specific restriction endonuclease McrA
MNKSWVVIGTTTVKDAIVLMSRGSAKGVCTDTFATYDWDNWLTNPNRPKVDFNIKTPNMEIPAPQVIILTNYNDVHQATVKFSQRAIYKRDNYTCQYCRRRFRNDQLSVDHVIPRSKGGESSFENCVASCTPCNNKKSDFALHEIGMTLARKPVTPKWNPVFHVTERPDSWAPLLKEDW